MGARFSQASEHDLGRQLPPAEARIELCEWHCPGRVSAWQDEHLPQFQIEFPLEGMDLRRLRGRQLVVDPSQVLLTAADEEFSLASPTARRRRSICLHLPASLLQAWAPELATVVLACRPELALALLALRQAPDPLAQEERSWQLFELVLASSGLEQGAANSDPSSTGAHSRPAWRALVEALRERMALDYSENLSLESLARSCGASAFHASRVFRQLSGQSIHQHLNQLRLRAALAQLPDRRGQLTALALDCGFASHSHFSSAFRAEFGRSPSSLLLG